VLKCKSRENQYNQLKNLMSSSSSTSDDSEQRIFYILSIFMVSKYGLCVVCVSVSFFWSVAAADVVPCACT
jgi:hypothetical protein